MAPRRGGGGIHLDFGGDGGSSIDPSTLGDIFLYVTLGCFGLYFLYIIFATLKHKRNYPYIFLYHAVAYLTFSTLFSVLVKALYTVATAALLYPAAIFMSIGYSLMWLFTFEPSRHIMNLQNNDPTFERASIFKIKQYLTGGGVGYTLLFSYFYFFIYVLMSIIAAILSTTMPYNATLSQVLTINNFNIYLAVGPWVYYVCWVYLTFRHYTLIPHVKSYFYYGFFLLLSIVISTVYVGIAEMDPMALVITNFVLYDCALIFAIYTALKFGDQWVSLTKYDFASK